MFLRTSSLKRLNSIGAAENIPCCVQKNTSLKFHFVVCKQRDYHNIGKQYGGLSSLWAIRLYSLLVWCFFEGGILPPKKETDSKVINALLSVWIFSFPSVGHLLYGYFMCAYLKDASFFGLILSKYERKIVPKTAWRLNLQISDNVRNVSL